MISSSQIIALACQIAKCPGYIVQGGQFLNARLIQIALDQDLDIIRRTTTFQTVIGQNAYPLPANFLRTREVFYNVNGTIYVCEQYSLEYYDSLFQGPGEVNYPYLYATDIAQSPPILNLYPAPSISTTVTVRYMDNLVEITTPETSSTIPWFQDQLLLIDMVAEDLMKITDDSRKAEFGQTNENKFRNLIQMANDKENRAITVKKDPATFRSVRTVKATKIQGD
jgi:hypothetical protein